MWAGSSSPYMRGYLPRRAHSSMPRTRQRLRSCEKSNIKAVPQFTDEPSLCGVVNIQSSSVEVLSHVLTHCNLIYVALEGMLQSLRPLPQSSIPVTSLSVRMGSRHAPSVDLMRVLVNSFLPVPM